MSNTLTCTIKISIPKYLGDRLALFSFYRLSLTERIFNLLKVYQPPKSKSSGKLQFTGDQQINFLNPTNLKVHFDNSLLFTQNYRMSSIQNFTPLKSSEHKVDFTEST